MPNGAEDGPPTRQGVSTATRVRRRVSGIKPHGAYPTVRQGVHPVLSRISSSGPDEMVKGAAFKLPAGSAEGSLQTTLALGRSAPRLHHQRKLLLRYAWRTR